MLLIWEYHMRRFDLTARELADLRDSVAYLNGSFRDLVESRHVFRDDDEKDDTGDSLLGAHYA